MGTCVLDSGSRWFIKCLMGSVRGTEQLKKECPLWAWALALVLMAAPGNGNLRKMLHCCPLGGASERYSDSLFTSPLLAGLRETTRQSQTSPFLVNLKRTYGVPEHGFPHCSNSSFAIKGSCELPAPYKRQRHNSFSESKNSIWVIINDLSKMLYLKK